MTSFWHRFALRSCALFLFMSLTGVTAFAVDALGGGAFNVSGSAPVSSSSSSGGAADGSFSSEATGPAVIQAPRAPMSPRGGSQSDVRLEARPPSAPAQPSEFQKFVEISTGRLLPIVGTGFFASTVQSFSPFESVPVAADYSVGPGDELEVRVWGAIDMDHRAIVDRNGLVNLPKVGSFVVAGVKAGELEKHLRAHIGRFFTNFNLNVTLGQLRGVKVFVVGPARSPGVYTVSSQSTLLSAVVATGGPSTSGSMRKILLRRDGRVISELDMYEFLGQGDKSKDVQLAAGDVVVFQPVGPRVALTGALDAPGIYELKALKEPLRDVLRYGVLTNPNRAVLERIDTSQKRAARFVEELKLDAEGLRTPLRDGDVLTLLPISPQFANAVTLKGQVAQPLRYPFKPGMRIRDLIPEPEALISPDFYRRKNLLVQVIKEDAGGRSTLRLDERTKREVDFSVAEYAQKPPAVLFDELNWNYATIERLNPNDLSTQLISFNLGKAVLKGDPSQNIELHSGDVVTIFSQKDIRVPVAHQTRLVHLEGEVGSPGIYQLIPGETLKQLLARAGGFTPNAYIYGLDFRREETRQRQRQNLAEAMTRMQALGAAQKARDSAKGGEIAGVATVSTETQLARLSRIEPNGRIALELEPGVKSIDELPELPLDHGDRISVPTRPGFVSVGGAIVNHNSYLWRPNRTVDYYIKLAGLDESAEPSLMFILRADGTVTHASNHSRVFGFGGIQSKVLYPGDAVIVPNQVDFETWGRALLRNLKDWSQIFAQFGLGAAAIQTLRQ